MPRYNLIICHVPGLQSRSDFETIRRNMVVRAPDINVLLISLGERLAPNFWHVAAQRPSLIFSPQEIPFPPGRARGAQLISKALNKHEELQVLERAGAPVPETVVIGPETRLDEASWGPFTVIKPVRGKQGFGVKLMRTKDVRWTDTSLLPQDHPRHGKVLLAQRHINTGPQLKSYRVMTVLGRPVYSALSTAVEAQPDPTLSTALEMDVAANNVQRRVTLNYDEEIIDLARSIHSKLPHLPSMGIDIIREHGSGRLFALEYNSRGGFWHISSNFGQNQQRTHGIDYMKQFGALDTITDALIEATRKRAI
jgi:glutathione synthase/RimK-type ligase-like ATP-grasp enzyme